MVGQSSQIAKSIGVSGTNISTGSGNDTLNVSVSSDAGLVEQTRDNAYSYSNFSAYDYKGSYSYDYQYLFIR